MCCGDTCPVANIFVCGPLQTIGGGLSCRFSLAIRSSAARFLIWVFQPNSLSGEV